MNIDRYYRFQAPLYDLTRSLFLFERQRAIQELDVRAGDTVVDAGCGTGYNLQMLSAKTGLSGKVYGVDCSESMLRVAEKKVRKLGLKNVVLVRDFAESFRPAEKADRILFSYSLSMIPDWMKALDNAIINLKEKGQIVIIDFYTWNRFRSLFLIWKRWLRLNHVYLSGEPLLYLKEKGVELTLTVYRGGYDYIASANF